MKRFYFGREIALLLVLSLGLLISCSTGRVITREDVLKIQEGKTTKQELVSALGLPNQRTVEGDKERWVYFKEASTTSVSLVTFDSLNQSIKSGVASTELEAITMANEPDVAAIVWLDKFGVVVKIIKQRGLK